MSDDENWPNFASLLAVAEIAPKYACQTGSISPLASMKSFLATPAAQRAGTAWVSCATCTLVRLRAAAFVIGITSFIADVPWNLLWAGIAERRPRYAGTIDRKSTRLNSSHVKISYAVFCLK